MDYYVTIPKEPFEPDVQHTALIKNRWLVNDYGFVDINFFIDCCLNYRKEAVTKALFMNRVFPAICQFPKEVVLDSEEDDSG